MTSRRIPRLLRQRVVTESHNRCAYCHSLTAITGARPVIDHIVPEAAGGQAVWENLCVACHACNEFKGAQVEAQDPLTDKRVPLFHPRQQQWREHFCWSEDGSTLIGLTPTGRATGWHPPHDDV
jgi:5-methylcytosine-specific restriction endonuclease McrA